MALPLIATAALGLMFQFPGNPQVPRAGIHPIKPTKRHSSIYTPGTRPTIPVAGAQGLSKSPVGREYARFVKRSQDQLFASHKPKKKVINSKQAGIASVSDRVLVVHDNWGIYAFIGELYGRQMVELLSHFGYPVDVVPAESYQAGMVENYRATVYIGTLYGTDLTDGFRADAMATEKPICWVGSNLWKIAWNEDYSENPAFEEHFGFRFDGLEDGFSSVTYKNESLSKFDTFISRTTITDETKAEVIATTANYDGDVVPYIIRSNNFYFVADNALSTVVYADQPGHDRTLALCDVLHDVLQDGVEEDHKALVRIEDVHAMADPDALREIADILAEQEVPFVVSTIPVYRDPLGYWTGGIPVDFELDMAPDIVDALKYMESKGGQIIQHGTTHQCEDVANPYSGVSGSDWEFFRVVTNGEGVNEYWGPVWDDSPEWVQARVEWGREVLQRCGFNPTGWLTPHYMASSVDYDYFANNFEYSLCPSVNFSIDDAGYLFYMGLFAPYPTIDTRGAVHLPETLSYVSPGTPNMDPATLVYRAQKMKVVRDGWAGLFFHPFLDPQLLKEAVVGVKAQGFTFVTPSAAYAPVTKG